MSLFASYYGIESSSSATVDTEAEAKRNPGLYIDKPLFNATAFVQEMLLQRPLEQLIIENTKIVQEVKVITIMKEFK